MLEQALEDCKDKLNSDAASGVQPPCLMSTNVLVQEDDDGRNGLEVLEASGFDDIAGQLRKAMQQAIDKLTQRIDAGDSTSPSDLNALRGDMLQLLGQTESAEADQAAREMRPHRARPRRNCRYGAIRRAARPSPSGSPPRSSASAAILVRAFSVIPG